MISPSRRWVGWPPATSWARLDPLDERDSFTVRPARPEDLAGILSVHAGEEAGGPTPTAPSGLQQRTWLRMMGTEDLTVYCADVGGTVVGTATVVLMPNLTYGCAPTAFVEAVAVVEPHRRRGIATAIMRRALDDARSAGCNKVQLLSHKRHAHDGAHRLYVMLGFEPEAEGFRLYLGEVPPAVRTARSADGV